MKVLQLKYITEKGKEAINKQNEKNKKNWKLMTVIRSTGGKISFIDGGMEFSHFIFKRLQGDLNSPGNAKSQNLKEKGFKEIEEALLKDGCVLDEDYKIEFIEVIK